MADSLWGAEFVVEETPKKARKIKEKISKPKNLSESEMSKKALKATSTSLEDKLALITTNVYRILGRYKEKTVVIKTREDLTAYIDAAISNGIIAIDTETNNSLQPITCKLMGPCIYTPGQKNAYIPLNHVNPMTRERLDWQLTEQDIFEEFDRLDNTLIIMHNGKFDYQVIKCTTGKQLKVYWDTMIGTRILDENEKNAGLKVQYINKIDPSIEKYSIDHLFENIEYAVVDPEVFALYAATDAFMTYELYEWQKCQFEKSGHERLYQVFMDVEMPVMEVAAEMELTGICIDEEYGQRLSKKYHDKLDSLNQQLQEELEKYDDIIKTWRLTEEATFKPEKINKKTGEKSFGKSKSEQLETPVSLTSPTQLAILIYDVLKHPIVDKKNPRGTGEDILKKIDIPLSSLILQQRGLLKLINTYIDKLPQCVCEKTGRLHAQFKQLGADTGRFSSSEPNLQNIPSHEKSIRMLFSASPGHVLVGSDFSQQEPRLLSNYAQDDNMINAYKEGKDLYATIASGVYNNTYWDNMEFTDETKTVPNPEGKKRRGRTKSILLGIMYGRGVASIAEQIGGSIKEAQKIVDDFYKGFPKVKKWMDETQAFARTYGYVEDLWGRRRRLPDIQLPKFEVSLKDNVKSVAINFNPLLGSLGIIQKQKDPRVIKYEKLAWGCKSRKEVEKLKEQALIEGVVVRDNSGFISQAERQCVNARIQGGAATMSKKAMIKVHHDPELKALGFKLMLAVHDELIGECPIENADKVADRLCDLMKVSALPECTVPFKCDPTIEKVWYYTDYSDTVREQYEKLVESGTPAQDAFNQIIQERCECTEAQLKEILNL
jgi:DNA polymerase I-like protein with 3'-5' exonuclease and polymerase domains